MQRIINGLKYDTSTADEICDISPSGFSSGDFNWEDTSLYRTKKGRYFLAGRGGAFTRWSVPIGQNGRGGGSGIQPVNEAEARSFVEQYASHRFEELFGVAEDA